MFLVRFQQLKRFLHIPDTDKDDQSNYFFDKLEPLLQHFKTTSQNLWNLGCKVSVDEMMITFSDTSKETIYIKNRPIPIG